VPDPYDALRTTTAAALLDSPGATAVELRQAIASGQPPPELAALVQKIQTRAYTVVDQDLDALRSRYTEEQLFEIMLAAAFGAASQRLAAAHRVLEDA
jgi:alkylhydroperoxidase family enzyme